MMNSDFEAVFFVGICSSLLCTVVVIILIAFTIFSTKKKSKEESRSVPEPPGLLAQPAPSPLPSNSTPTFIPEEKKCAKCAKCAYLS